MYKFRHILQPLLIFLLVLFAITSSSYGAYIRSSKVELKESPEFSSATISRVNKGDEAIILEADGFWTKVRVNNSTGWISKMSLVEKKRFLKITRRPLHKNKGITKKRIRTRVARAAVGVKGLRQSQVEKIRENYNIKAIEIVETFKVAEAKAVSFLMDYHE